MTIVDSNKITIETERAVMANHYRDISLISYILQYENYSIYLNFNK